MYRNLLFNSASGIAGTLWIAESLREWGRLRSLTVKIRPRDSPPELSTLLQDLAGATQLRSMALVLPKEREAETRPRSELGEAVARLRAERPQLQLRLLLE